MNKITRVTIVPIYEFMTGLEPTTFRGIMSEVTPPPPPPTPPATPPSAQPTAVVTNPPEALARELALGARLDATIAATQSRGQFELETAFGRIVIKTSFPLPSEGLLQLQLLAKGAQFQFLIISVHGLSPQAALRALGLGAGGANAPTPGAPAGAAAGGGAAAPGAVSNAPAAVSLTLGSTFSATLLRPGPPPGAVPPATGVPGGQAGGGSAGPGQGTTPGAAPATAPGQGTTPGAAPATAPGQGPPGTGGAPGQPAAGSHTQPGAPGVFGAGGGPPGAHQATPPGPGAAPAQGTGAGLVPGTLFSLRITAFEPAAAGTNASILSSLKGPGDLAPGNTLTGIVTGRSVTSGHPIVQTHAGSLIVATGTLLPAGITVTFEILSQSAPTPAAGEQAAIHAARLDLILSERWPGLEEAVRALEGVNPSAAQQLVNAVLPRPGATLAANILFFLVALSGGDLRGWLGDGPARILQRLKPGLMARLRDDFGRLGRIANEPRTGDWRATMIPFYNGAEIEQIRLFIRRAGDEAEDEREGRQGTRGVLDMDLSRMGRFQLDGLIYQKERHLDLIVRTENKLPQKMQDDIRDIFREAGDVTGIKGGLSFQAAPPNFIDIAGAEPPQQPLGLIV